MWYKIENFNYEINKMGHIKALRTNKLIRPYESNGYWKVDLYKDAERRKVYVHQIICETFHKDTFFDGAIVNHKDGDRKNNTPENLEWATYSSNNRHAYETLGRIHISPKRGDSPHAKAIVKMDMDGNELESYSCITDAALIYGGQVERCLSGRNKTAYGFKWAYKNIAA